MHINVMMPGAKGFAAHNCRKCLRLQKRLREGWKYHMIDRVRRIEGQFLTESNIFTKMRFMKNY